MKCLLSSMLYFSATVETAVTVQKKSGGTCAGGDSDNWFVRSHSLRENGITVLHPSETDRQTMPEILMIVLGDEGIEKTRGLSTTQANEATN